MLELLQINERKTSNLTGNSVKGMYFTKKSLPRRPINM